MLDSSPGFIPRDLPSRAFSAPDWRLCPFPWGTLPQHLRGHHWEISCFVFLLQISPLDDPGQFWWVMPFQTLASGCLVPAPSQTSQRRSCLPVHALRDMFWFCNFKQIAQTWRPVEADDWSFALCKCGLFCLFRLSWDISPSSHVTRFLRDSLESWTAVFSKFIWTNSLPLLFSFCHHPY